MNRNQSVIGFRSRETWISCLQEYCLSGASSHDSIDKAIELCSKPEIRKLLVDFQNNDEVTRQYILPVSQQLESEGHNLEATTLLSLELLFFLEPIKDVSAFDDESTRTIIECLDTFSERFFGVRSAFTSPLHG